MKRNKQSKAWVPVVCVFFVLVFVFIMFLAHSGHRGKDVEVNGYYKKDGTYVHPYSRHSPR
jgi:hypothetical protein